VRLFHPVKPMLAQTVDTMEEAFEAYGGNMALEFKLDGARVQIHIAGERVRIYSRQLSDVTDSLPDVVSVVRQGVQVEEAILEGEVLAVDDEGRPLPFQHLMRRFRRKHDIAETVHEVPIELHLFDILCADGQTLVDAPNRERWRTLAAIAGPLRLVERIIPTSIDTARAFAEAAHRAGHEGVMVKDLDSAYRPGVRGKAWLKLKRVVSLDLVIVAADWGYGRRHGWLSNYHLAALDADTGEYRVVGKTYKGLTDAEFQRMTERLLGLERARRGSTVHVEPHIVVEVLFNEVQASTQYASGLALRFARIARLRDDKSPHDADTLQTLRDIYERQFHFKGRPA